MIVHDSVLADCIEKVECQRGDKITCEILSTPRTVPKIVLKSAWKLQQQQEQQQQDTLRGCGKPRAEQTQGTPTDNPNARSFGKPLRGIELPVAEKEPEFKVYLRNDGIPQYLKITKG